MRIHFDHTTSENKQYDRYNNSFSVSKFINTIDADSEFPTNKFSILRPNLTINTIIFTVKKLFFRYLQYEVQLTNNFFGIKLGILCCTWKRSYPLESG